MEGEGEDEGWHEMLSGLPRGKGVNGSQLDERRPRMQEVGCGLGIGCDMYGGGCRV